MDGIIVPSANKKTVHFSRASRQSETKRGDAVLPFIDKILLEFRAQIKQHEEIGGLLMEDIIQRVLATGIGYTKTSIGGMDIDKFEASINNIIKEEQIRRLRQARRHTLFHLPPMNRAEDQPDPLARTPMKPV